jgi:hypothetical protein
MTMTPELSTESSCPKCQRRREEETTQACPRCGLVFSRWSPDKAAQVVKLDERAEMLWSAVRRSWKDEGKHDAFLKYCSMAGLLAPAGRNYRARLDRHPDDAIAAAMQERIVAMATLSFARPTTPPKPVTRTQWFWIILVVGVIAGVMASFLIHH